MFLSHRVPIKTTSFNKHGETNELKLVFESAWVRGKKEEAENGGKLGLCEHHLVCRSSPAAHSFG